jgi:hypothetical protein
LIRALSALTRQVEEFFHQHLIGLYRWDEVEFMPVEKTERIPPDQWERTSRGKRIRPEPPEGRYHAERSLRFGMWDLTISGPSERPPLGWLVLKGHETVEGPIDASTWGRFAEYIKKHHEENENAV